MYRFSTLFLLGLLAVACSGEKKSDDGKSGPEPHLEVIQEQEARFFDIVNNRPGSADLNAVALRLAEEYLIFADRFPDHEESPEFLFRAANLRADALGEYNLAIGVFNRVIRDYPGSPQAESSLFLIGYTQAEHLRDYDSARETYDRFLEKHPDSELTETVKLELQFLGRSVDELLEFLQRNEND